MVARHAREAGTTQLDELTHMTTITSLPNRAFLHKHLHEALVESAQEEAIGYVLQSTSIIFKLLNDSVGQVKRLWSLFGPV